MTIKSLLKYAIPAVFIGCLLGLPALADAPNFWLLQSNYLKPISSLWGLQLPGLLNKSCLGTDGSGHVQAGSCGGAGGATTTINSLIGPNFTMTGGANISISTSAPSTLTLTGNTFFATVCSSHCDYTTTGTNDDTIINNAITAASAAGGGTILLKSGTYNQQATSINIKSGVSLECDGDGTTIKTTTTTSQSIYFNGAYNASLIGCHVTDITPDNLAFGITSYRMVEVHDSHNIKVERNTFDNSSGYGVYTTSSANNSTTFVSILNNFIQANGHQDTVGGGPFVQGNSTTSDVSIIGNTIISKVGNGTVGVNVDANCLDMVAVNHIIFSHNNCYGQVWFGSEKVPNSYSEIIGNVISPAQGATSTSGDIEIRQSVAGIATLTPTQLLITNNILTGGGIRLEGSPTSSITSTIVANNTIKNAGPTAQGANGTPPGYGIYFDYVTNSIISDNNINSSNSTPPTGSVGILLANTTSNITTTGNTIKDYATGSNFGNITTNKSQLDVYNNDTATFINTGSLLNLSGSTLQFTTSGANSAILQINDAGGSQQAGFKLQDAGTSKWEVGKQTDNTFFIYDDANSRNILQSDASGNLNLVPAGGSLTVTGTSTMATTTISRLTLGNAISNGCLQTTSGVVSSTGVACGSGGGGGLGTTTPFTSGYVPYATSTLTLTDSPIAIANGKVGIGIVVPGYLLHLQATSSGATSQMLKLQNSATAIDTGASIDFNMSTSDLTTNPTAQIAGVRSGGPGGRLEFYTLSGAGVSTRGMYINQLQIVNASSTLTTNATTTGQAFFSGILGKLLATDPAGMVIATSSPIFSLANGTNTTASGNAVNLNASLLGMTLFSGTTVKASSTLVSNATTTGQQFLTGITAGTLLATNPQGMVISTTSPIFSLANGTNTTASGNAINLNASLLGMTLFAGTTVNATSGNFTTVSIGTTTSVTKLYIQNAGGSTDIFRMASSTNAVMTIFDSTGHLQIGTTTDTAQISIMGASGQTINYLNVSSSTGASVFSVSDNATPNLQLGTSTLTTINIAAIDSVANATTTMQLGDPTHPTCIKTFTSAGVAVYWTVVGTTWTGSTSTCKVNF